MDNVKTEAETQATSAAETTSKNNSFKDWLIAFKSKFQRKSSSTQVSSPQSPPTENASATEKSPYKSKLEQKRATERLSFAPRIFFHTTPMERLDSIERNGLFGYKDDPNVSDHLGYSLYFGFEHTHVRGDISSVSGKDPLKETPDNYVLTVWKGNGDLKKAPQQSFKESGFRVVAGKTSEVEIPDSFYQASPMGSILQLQPAEIGKLSKDNFLAAIPLTRPVREELVKLMILAQTAVFDADKIQANIESLLRASNPEVKGVNYADVAYLLTVSLERSLVAGIIKPAFEKAKNSPKIRQTKNLTTRPNYFYGEPLKALWQAYNYRLNINDKVSARYLDRVISQLTKVVQDQGVDIDQLFQRFDQNVEQLKQGKIYDLKKEGYQLMDFANANDYFGSTTDQAAYWMLQNQQLAEYNFVKDF